MSNPFVLGENEAVVICPHHGQVVLSRDEYIHQLSKPDSFWKCPTCGAEANWDDDNYEAWLEKTEGIWEECEVCKGTGVVTCKRCKGTGWAGGLNGEPCCGGVNDCPACGGAGGKRVLSEM